MSAAGTARHRDEERVAARVRRVAALVRKETKQVVRDPSSIAIGVVLPLILILLFGYGLSLDVRNVPVALVLEDPSPAAAELAASFRLSPYFDARTVRSFPEAERMLLDREVDGIVRLREDFGRRVATGEADVQVVLHGIDSNSARIIEGYTRGAVGAWTARRATRGRHAAAGAVVVRDRMWFNEANDSRRFLVPGLVVLVMSLMGATLTALVMAREWERGTIEALFVTPVRAGEILIGKTVPYFALGLVGFSICFLSARLLFDVPLRGSLALLVGVSMLYLLVSLGIGLLVSSVFKSQLVAGQIALIVTFMPSVMLSGFLYDLRSMPAPIQAISRALPPRYYVTLLQTEFLAGDVPSVVLPNVAVLAFMGLVLLRFTHGATRKRLVR